MDLWLKDYLNFVGQLRQIVLGQRVEIESCCLVTAESYLTAVESCLAAEICFVAVDSYLLTVVEICLAVESYLVAENCLLTAGSCLVEIG